MGECDGFTIKTVKYYLIIMSKSNVNNMGYIGRTPGTVQRDSDSWYTPEKYLESARNVLGGFELDPFTSVIANQKVKADKIFTEDDDALKKDWRCVDKGTVWMNPPYGKLMTKAVDKFIEEFSKGKFKSGIVLCNNATDTKWFAKLISKSSAICFTDHRIQFENIDGKNVSGNTRGQCFVFFGKMVNIFAEEFKQYGLVTVNYFDHFTR